MNWDEYYMNVAKTVAQKSKDPSTKVGAVIATKENRPVSFGFNGFIAGADDKYMTFERPMKYLLTVHAEMNALLFAEKSVRGCKIFVTHASCENCLKHMIQAGIKEIYYDQMDTKGKIMDEEKVDAVTRLIRASGVVYENINNGKSFLEEIAEAKRA